MSHISTTSATPYWVARGDYSQIEARVNAWFAGQSDIIAAFRALDGGTGPDLYCINAAQIFGVPIDKKDPRRQIGKVATLACGFGGGAGAFAAFARLYNVTVPEEQAQEIVTKWRAANQRIVAFWYALEKAAVTAVQRRGERIPVPGAPLWYRCGNRFLALMLPSGRPVIYWYPRLQHVETNWGPRWKLWYHSEDVKTKRFTENAAWYGLLCENVVQATARDIMAEALVRLNDAGLEPILSVHDEGVCRVPKARYAESSAAALAVRNIMESPPAWASGLPIAVEASAGPRYVKA